jgi:hypothetical protein
LLLVNKFEKRSNKTGRSLGGSCSGPIAEQLTPSGRVGSNPFSPKLLPMEPVHSVTHVSGLDRIKVVGAKGFEPSTSWSRTRHLNPINALSGVAYGTRSVISPLLVVPKLYLAFSIRKKLVRDRTSDPLLAKQLYSNNSTRKFNY